MEECSAAVKILNSDHRHEFSPTVHSWISPDHRYGVAEIYRGELFAVGKVVQYRPDRWTMELLEEFRGYSDTVDSRSYRVEWQWMPYGFFKISCQELDSGEIRSHRIYFNRALYEKKCAQRKSRRENYL